MSRQSGSKITWNPKLTYKCISKVQIDCRTHFECSARMTKDAFQPMRWSLCSSICPERWSSDAKDQIAHKQFCVLVWVGWVGGWGFDNVQVSRSQFSNQNITVANKFVFKVTYKEIDEMIETVDKNGDGKISFSEFRWIYILHDATDLKRFKSSVEVMAKTKRSNTNSCLPGWWWVVFLFSSPTTRRQKSQMERKNSGPTYFYICDFSSSLFAQFHIYEIDI